MSELAKFAATMQELQQAYRRLAPVRYPSRNMTTPAKMTEELATTGRLRNLPLIGPVTIANNAQVAAAKEGLPPSMAAMADRIPRPENMHGKIMMPKGGLTKALPKLMDRPREARTPEGQRGQNVLTGLHEGFERGVKPHEMARIGSHMSPQVLLKEHNMLAKATGAGADDARQTFQAMRNDTGESYGMNNLLTKFYGPEVGNNFRFGEGEKIPKAMRKDFTAKYRDMYQGELAKNRAQLEAMMADFPSGE